MPPEERYKFHVGDFVDVVQNFPDESFDAVICDPPYDRKALSLYKNLGMEAPRLLKPGAPLVVMTGQAHLPTVMANLGAGGLQYQWTIACLLEKRTIFQFRNVVYKWKPIVVFSKGKYNGGTYEDMDVLESAGPDKDFHTWGQNVAEFRKLVDKFTYKGGVVLDPFLGGGTTAVACLQTGRKCVGIDVDPKCISDSEKRISEMLSAEADKSCP